MQNILRRAAVAVLLLAMLLTFAGCKGKNADGPKELKTLTIGTADTTGTMYSVGVSLASIINDNSDEYSTEVKVTKGSYANCRDVQNGDVDMATITGDTASLAVKGMGNFEEEPCPKLRAICAVYTSISNWISLKSSGITMVNQLDGKRVAIGPEGSATEAAALIGLEACGVKPSEMVNLWLGDGANEVSDGEMAAAHGFAGIPVAGLLSVTQTVPCNVLGFTKEELAKVEEINPSYYMCIIPAGTYPGQDEEVVTFGVKCLLVVSADMDDETAYNLTKLIATHIPDLVAGHMSMRALEASDFMCKNLSIELHPGTLKYYKEAGFIVK